MKGVVVAVAAVIGLQGMAFAAVSQHPLTANEGKHVLSQDAVKVDSKNTKVMQVAGRLSSGLRINTACDDTGLPCPPRR
ncbi:hypothetical protein [Pseudomonas sp. NPDC089734]|uniref:hypothetical protein n=1 Tax=Pseudomonas sp. NPDC089734 TaxID=3364469 RepID=UPI0037FC6D1A